MRIMIEILLLALQVIPVKVRLPKHVVETKAETLPETDNELLPQMTKLGI